MASNSITHFLFLSLLLFHSIFLVKCDDGPDDEDNLLQGINQYRSSISLPPITHNKGLECLADDIADRFQNQPCSNTTPPTQPKVSDYPDLLAKCMLNNGTLQDAQILPVCLPESQSTQLLTSYTGPRYASYLNDTRFSSIGIGNDDNWTIVILNTATSGTPSTPGTPATGNSNSSNGATTTGGGNSNPNSGASGLATINTAMVLIIGLSVFSLNGCRF